MKNNLLAAKTVSVAIASYNGENYLAEQLESILKQTVLPTEIVVVDDSSSDGTLQLLQSYRSNYPELFKIYNNRLNLGATKSFERAVNLCSGDYIALADQDDIWLANKLEVMLSEIGSAELIHSDAIVINNQHEVINSSLLALIGFKPDCSFFERLIREGVHGCCLMMSRRVAELAKVIPEGFVFHDFYYNLVAAKIGSVVTLSKPLMYYRLHESNACGLETAISYSRLRALYFKNLNNMQLLLDDLQFSEQHEQIEFYITYYRGVLGLKPCSFKFIYRVLGRMGKQKGIALLLAKCLGASMLEKIYNLQAKWRNK